MYKYSLNIFNFHFRMKVLQYVLFVIMMVLIIFGSAVHGDDNDKKQEGERCRNRDECAEGLTCRHIGAPGFGNLGECRP